MNIIQNDEISEAILGDGGVNGREPANMAHGEALKTKVACDTARIASVILSACNRCSVVSVSGSVYYFITAHALELIVFTTLIYS